MKKIHAYLACCLLVLIGCSSASKLLVKSDPPGADIYIDGEKVGKTPAALKVCFSESVQLVTEKKILSVRMPGYKEKKEVICPENTNNKTFEFTLVPVAPDNIASPVVSKPSSTAAREENAAPAVVSGPSVTTLKEGEAVPPADSSASVTTKQEGESPAGEDGTAIEKTADESGPAADNTSNIAAPPAAQETAPVATADMPAIPAPQATQ